MWCVISSAFRIVSYASISLSPSPSPQIRQAERTGVQLSPGQSWFSPSLPALPDLQGLFSIFISEQRRDKSVWEMLTALQDSRWSGQWEKQRPTRGARVHPEKISTARYTLEALISSTSLEHYMHQSTSHAAGRDRNSTNAAWDTVKTYDAAEPKLCE